MALVTYLVRTCPPVLPSSWWEPLLGCVSGEPQAWEKPLVPGEKGPSTPGDCCQAPGCSDRGPAPPCPPWPLPPDQFSPARATLQHPHPSQNQRQSRPTWNPTFVSSTHSSSCVHPFPPRCEALEVTVMNGLRASELPQPGRPGILWPASRAAAQLRGDGNGLNSFGFIPCDWHLHPELGRWQCPTQAVETCPRTGVAPALATAGNRREGSGQTRKLLGLSSSSQPVPWGHRGPGSQCEHRAADGTCVGLLS